MLTPLPFPTRRSSDLERVVIALRGVVSLVPRILETARQPLHRKIRHDGNRLQIGAGENVGRRHVLNRDRKSTRLNSSHLVISYAVFCLKKKNTMLRTK